jgi:uncharacterized membrane protein
LKRVTIIILLSISLLMIWGTGSYADIIRYNITHYTINADIQSDGGIDVTEFISYKFKSSSDFVTRTIDDINTDNKLYSAKNISNIQVYEASLIEDDMFKYNLGEGKAGDKGIYSLIKTENGIKINIFSPAKDEEKRFVIQYHLSAAVVKYKDCADFYWKFIGDNWTIPLNDVDIVVTIPTPATNLRMFSHGPLDGINAIVDPSTVEYTLPLLKTGESVSLRVLFPSSIINSKDKFINENKLKDILNKEEKLVFDANIKKIARRLLIALVSLWPFPCIMLLILLFNYIRSVRKY